MAIFIQALADVIPVRPRAAIRVRQAAAAAIAATSAAKLSSLARAAAVAKAVQRAGCFLCYRRNSHAVRDAAASIGTSGFRIRPTAANRATIVAAGSGQTARPAAGRVAVAWVLVPGCTVIGTASGVSCTLDTDMDLVKVEHVADVHRAQVAERRSCKARHVAAARATVVSNKANRILNRHPT